MSDPNALRAKPAAETEEARRPSQSRGTAGSQHRDEDLLRRIRDRDESAFTELVERYHGRLLQVARLFVADAPAAEEVVQDTWLATLDGLAGFRGESSFKTWIFRILTNRAKTRGVRDGGAVTFSALEPNAERDGPAVEQERFNVAGMWQSPPSGLERRHAGAARSSGGSARIHCPRHE